MRQEIQAQIDMKAELKTTKGAWHTSLHPKHEKPYVDRENKCYKNIKYSYKQEKEKHI